MSKDFPLFDSPQLKHTFGDTEKIKFIVHTDSFAYVVTEDGKIYRTLFVNLKLAKKQEFTEFHPWGKCQIKKIVPHYKVSHIVRNYSLIVLVNQKLYSIPEDVNSTTMIPTPITTIPDPIDDFAIKPNREKLLVLSKKRLFFLSLANNFGQLGKSIECQDSNIVCTNDSAIIYGKGEKLFMFNSETFNNVPPPAGSFSRFGVAQGYMPKSFDRKVLEQNVAYQYYKIRKSDSNEICFVWEGPFQDLKLNAGSEVVDFTISYPYAFITYGKTFSMICIPFEQLNQKYEFSNSFTSQTLCILPNRMLLLGVSNNLYFIKFTEAYSQVNFVESSGGDKSSLTALELCLSFQESEKDISLIEHQLFHKYGAYLLTQDKVTEAFQFFQRDLLPPAQVFKYFPEIFPHEALSNFEIVSLKKPYLQVKDRHVTGIKSYDVEKVKALQDYIYFVLDSQKNFDAMNQLIIYSILAKCIAITDPDNFETFIKEHYSDIYFESTSNFFMSLNSVSMFCQLCQVHGQHTRAIKYFQSKKNYDSIIKYITSSPDYAVLAKTHFKDLVDYIPERSYEVFCSPNLDMNHIIEGGSVGKDGSLLNFIQNLSNNQDIVKKIDVTLVEIKFLRFCIFDKNFVDKRLCMRLCELYIKKLQPLTKERAGKQYISISQENEQNKLTRKGLIEVLELGEVEIEIDPVFIEEKVYSIVYSFLKQNINGSSENRSHFFQKLSDCFDLLCKVEIDFEITQDFCQKTAKKLSINPGEIYTLLLNKLVEKDSDVNRKRIVTLVNNNSTEIDYAQAISKLPSSVTLYDISKLLETVSVDRVNELRRLEIENALLEETIKRKKQQLKYLKGGYAHITGNTFCAICGREFHDQLFYVRPDNTVTHIMCLNEGGTNANN
ncbi:hypothetical protein TVAG_285960 [Trichomonas vaginalis G3]|uniref:Uncharacterized protein n=1 Tax=Trichomonas vaginalis (strain ATCC PRA-98 / G3) TaxID=412133 RepID=A2FMU0_TRIV3|nr:CNH domain containing family [Trichomonas vaginalis G3]EAX93757.1 hypothetical protein TVAG_285960 [Trichomonas vaginalis G3]KAI5497688.1 CNH domain containing family [Trichomonas vaginalis G3]|eukprot:XP_001306687.1 hypothetical protein [Trichomonas vaginalis G3]